MSTSTTTLCCYIGVHLLLLFLISLCLGLCLTRSRCVFTVIFNDSDFEEARELVAPLVFFAGYLVNVLAVGRLLQQLRTSQPTLYEQRDTKLL